MHDARRGEGISGGTVSQPTVAVVAPAIGDMPRGHAARVEGTSGDSRKRKAAGNRDWGVPLHRSSVTEATVVIEAPAVRDVRRGYTTRVVSACAHLRETQATQDRCRRCACRG